MGADRRDEAAARVVSPIKRMPINKERRTADFVRALALMAEAQGDEQLNAVVFASSQPRFAELIPRTWRELLDAGLIEDRGERPGPTFD